MIELAVGVEGVITSIGTERLQAIGRPLTSREEIRAHLTNKFWPVEFAMLGVDKRASDQERSRLKEDPIYRGQVDPVGDGSPVLFGAGYFATKGYYREPLTFFNNAGYKAQVLSQKFPFNIEPIGSAIKPMMDEIEEAAQVNGKPATLVVHSIAGYKALFASLRYPERFWGSVRRVNLMGTYYPLTYINAGVGLAQEATQALLLASDYKMLEEMHSRYNLGDIREDLIDTYGSLTDPVIRGGFLGTPHLSDTSHCGFPLKDDCLYGVLDDLPKKTSLVSLQVAA